MTTTNMTVQQSGVAIDKLIGLIGGNLTRYRNYTKDAVIAIIRHTVSFGDCDKAKALARAVNPKDRTALIEFFRLYSPIRITMGKTASEDKVRLCHADKASYTPFNLDGAIAQTDWWDIGKEEKAKPFKAVADFFDTVAKSAKPSEKVLEGYDPAVRQEIAAISADMLTLIEKYRVMRLAAVGAQAPGSGSATSGTTVNVPATVRRAA